MKQNEGEVRQKITRQTDATAAGIEDKDDRNSGTLR